MNTRRYLIGGLGVGMLGLLAHGALSGRQTPKVSGPGTLDLPNTPLFNQDGRRFAFYDDLVRGKVVVLNMMYTNCGATCPTSIANLRGVQRMLGDRLGRDVFMYSLTLQPELDQPRHLREYIERYRLGPNWDFFTGDPQDMYALRYALGFYDIEPEVDANQFTHTGMVRVGNEPINRWTMVPSLTAPEHILYTINHVDPRVSLTGHQQPA